MDSTISCSNRARQLLRMFSCCLLCLLMIPGDMYPMARLAQRQTTKVAVRNFTTQTPKMERRAVCLMTFLYCSTPLGIVTYLDATQKKQLRKEREAARQKCLENYEWKRKHCWTETRRAKIDGLWTGIWYPILICDDTDEAFRRGIK